MYLENIEDKKWSIMTDKSVCIGTLSVVGTPAIKNAAELIMEIEDINWRNKYVWYGIVEALDISFTTLGMDKIYWRISIKNKVAIDVCLKHGFNCLDEDIPKDILSISEDKDDFKWFAVLKGDDYHNEALSRENIAGCKIIKIRTVPTISEGELSFFEANRDIPFEIKRMYYITKVPEGIKRGFHAHQKLKQFLFCPYGNIKLILEDENVREEILLNDPSIGILIEKSVWREMEWLEENSVLAVAASEYYDSRDYIKEYGEFRKYIANSSRVVDEGKNIYDKI